MRAAIRRGGATLFGRRGSLVSSLLGSGRWQRPRPWVSSVRWVRAPSRSCWQKTSILGPFWPWVPHAERLCYALCSDATRWEAPSAQAEISGIPIAEEGEAAGSRRRSPVHRRRHGAISSPRELAQPTASLLADWQLDPAELAKADEALSCLSILRRRFAIRLVETGHQRRAVYEAGYHPSPPAPPPRSAQAHLSIR